MYADSWLLAKCAKVKAKQVVFPYANPNMRKKYLNRSSFMVIVKVCKTKGNEMFLCLNPSAALVLFDRLCSILREIHEKWLLLVEPA